ncbi:MAG TPA: hypothetical protein VET48_04915 [Steroidobacteraceae bacterium]|nr:hypothetical protein [Steroidobacteraceae bacterium]
MAATRQKTRTVTTTERELPTETVTERETKPEKDEADERDLVELGGGATSGNRWVVKCIAPIAQAGHCCDIAAGELSLARIAEEYGPGKYEFRLLDPHGKYVEQRTVTLRASSKLSNTAANQPSAESSPLLNPMVQLMLKQSEAQVAMLTNILQSALARPQPAVADPLDMMIKLKEFFQPNKGPTEMETFLRGLEFGKDLQGGGGETNWLDLISQGVKHVGPLIANGIQSQTSALSGPQVPVESKITTQTNTARAPATVSDGEISHRVSSAQRTKEQIQPNNEANPMLKLISWLRMQANALVYQASRQRNPQVYAEVFVDNLPNYVPVDEMLKRMKEPNAIAQLAQFNPAVSQFPEWFETFRATVIQIIESDMNPQVVSEQPQAQNATQDDQDTGGSTADL